MPVTLLQVLERELDEYLDNPQELSEIIIEQMDFLKIQNPEDFITGGNTDNEIPLFGSLLWFICQMSLIKSHIDSQFKNQRYSYPEDQNYQDILLQALVKRLLKMFDHDLRSCKISPAFLGSFLKHSDPSDYCQFGVSNSNAKYNPSHIVVGYFTVLFHLIKKCLYNNSKLDHLRLLKKIEPQLEETDELNRRLAEILLTNPKYIQLKKTNDTAYKIHKEFAHKLKNSAIDDFPITDTSKEHVEADDHIFEIEDIGVESTISFH